MWIHYNNDDDYIACDRFGRRMPIAMCKACEFNIDLSHTLQRADCQYRPRKDPEAYPPKGENKSEAIYLPYSVYSADGYEYLLKLIGHMGYDPVKTYPDNPG